MAAALEQPQPLPRSLLQRDFDAITLRREASALHVDFTMGRQLRGERATGWRTGVALDGSASMRDWYGKRLKGDGAARDHGRIRTARLGDQEGRRWASHQELAKSRP